MNHSDARRAISERMDGERLSSRAAGALHRHLSSCGTCRSFESGAWRLREAARFGVAEPVPDLVGPIMAAVAAERTEPHGSAWRRPPGSTRWSRAVAPVAASVVVGLLAGSLTVGGPWRGNRRTTLASAADVSAGIAAAASRLRAYQATFAIDEIDPTHPPRHHELSMNVAFRAPERFRLDVADHTTGAGTRFVADDLQLIVDGASAYEVAPSACPVGVCPERERVVRNRVPFSSATPAPTDLILPVSTLVDARQMTVVGRGTVLGREAVEVRLSFERARPLFPFLTLGGTWRPIFPGDRVDLWLDAHSWFPLRYAVYPAARPKRDEWQLRFGLPEESPGTPILEVRALAIDEAAAPDRTFRIRPVGSTRDEGGIRVSLAEVRRTLPKAITPAEVDGLPLYRAVVVETERSHAVLTYSSGLSWVKLGEARTSDGESFFDPVGSQAQAIHVGGVGTAYYQPASSEHGRRLAIHTQDGEVYLETNLPRYRLLDAAAALHLDASPVPTSWLTTTSPVATTSRMPLTEAERAVPFDMLLPQPTPLAYTLGTAEVIDVDDRPSLNVYYQPRGAALDAGALRLHEESAGTVPPASAARQFSVEVRGIDGRWTPGRNQLEWVERGLYLSLDASGLELEQLLDIARSLAPVRGSPSRSPAGSASPSTSAAAMGAAGGAPAGG